MKKIVLKLELEDGKAKQKALKTVAALQGIDSISMDMKEKKLTVTGIVDPVRVVKKLRKYWPDTAMMLVGPAKDPEKPPPSPEKKEEPAKSDAANKGSEEEQPKEGPNQAGGEEGKKEGSDNTDGKKEGENMMSTGGLVVVDGKPLHPPPDPVLELVKAYKAYNPQMTTYYYVPSMEENPNACAIC